jgi:hypothetical protein
MPGILTSNVEVTNVSQHGFWILLESEELFLSYVDFPWFKKAMIEQLLCVERPSENHLYWPQLDVDLSVDSIRNPDAFPLIAS